MIRNCIIVSLVLCVALSFVAANPTSNPSSEVDSNNQVYSDLLKNLIEKPEEDNEEIALHRLQAALDNLYEQLEDSEKQKRLAYRYGKRMTYRYGKRAAMPYRFGKRSDESGEDQQLSKRLAYRYGK